MNQPYVEAVLWKQFLTTPLNSILIIAMEFNWHLADREVDLSGGTKLLSAR